MLKATAYHLSTNAQPIPKQQLPHVQLPTDLKFFHTMSYFMEYPLGKFRLAVLILFPPSFLCPLSNPGSLEGQYKKLKNPCLCAATAQHN